MIISLRLAYADPADPVDFARGIRVERIDNRAVVIRGSVRAPLSRGQIFGFSVEAGSNELEINPDNCWDFGQPEPRRFTLDMLEARLENAAALKLHRVKRYAEAAPGFEKALRLDPAYILAAYNLASTLSLQGKKEQAVAALAPFLKKELPRVYLAMLQDPELLPLLETQAITALRAGAAGTGVLKEPDPRWLSHSAQHGLLAALDPHRGLVIFSLSSGQQVAQLDMGSEYFQYSCEGCEKELEKAQRVARAKARAVFMRQLPLANRLLTSLGFNSVAQREEGQACKGALCFRPSGLSAALDDDGLAVHKTSKPIMEAERPDMTNRLSAATYLPRLNVIIYRWIKTHGSTECHAQAGVELTLINPIKK